ncbi:MULTISPECIES: hypothetical protein [unclassified Bacillus (in: firmicutes)]|uniref:hypothetical protein n=1 Tax=unclassified Bacillus (in: firmicutes) TaxID=185979 RepID=UPI000C777430|nr:MULTISPECIES: hypothetical protein [unclassified Bacillus (in: firmicutes)]MDT0160455.1 hypothetical protein [Bacillus sp. AG4(2022)]PLR72178.1 hypothetical protein CYJ37_11520 [Bacillus sp. UMB0728]
MNEKVFHPKKGWYAEFYKFPRFGGWSFVFGLTKELVQHCMNGYENPITHSGYKTGFFATAFGYQIAVGYNSVKEVK